MLKITEQRGPEQDSVFLVLEGRLTAPWVEELNAVCRQMLVRRQRCAVIDLSGVTFIDAGGKALLARLWKQGAKLQASGCLTRCVVEEITGLSRLDPPKGNRETLA